MKNYLLLFILLSAIVVKAQVKDSTIKKRNNTLTLNVGGEAFYFGPVIAFEKSILNTTYVHAGLGGGVGCTYGLRYTRGCLPTYLNVRFGKARHFLELNTGVNHLIDFNPNPATKSDRKEYSQHPEQFFWGDYRAPYIPSYFVTLNYVFKGYNGFVYKIGCTGNRTKLDFFYPAYYALFPRLSIGYAF